MALPILAFAPDGVWVGPERVLVTLWLEKVLGTCAHALHAAHAAHGHTVDMTHAVSCFA